MIKPLLEILTSKNSKGNFVKFEAN